MYIDSHSHWSDSRFASHEIKNLLQKSTDQNITQFMLGGVDPIHWQKQIELSINYPGHFLKCFGLHPYFVTQNSIEVCELALDQLALQLNQSIGLGETGLDFRESIISLSKDSPYEVMARQIEFFENQLQMSKSFQKPLILHVVKAHEKALEVLDFFGDRQSGGFVHAFNGSYETALDYIRRGYLISVGGAVTYSKNKKLRQAVLKIPLDCLLLESDCPDQPPEGWSGYNDSSSLWQIARAIAEITQTQPEEILQTTTNNFKKLFSV